ncbi:MAG: helix-turn-helix transcriptional regulator [Thermomicrobiales bacterium]
MATGGPLISPALVGREPELAHLRVALDALAAGHGGIALVSGEAGIGKSRLIAELQAETDPHNYLTVRTACLESDRTEPYALALELARAAGGDTDLPSVAPEADRQVRRVQEALRGLLAHAAGLRPVILVAEDLHWSDASSLDVLLGLAQRPGPILLVLTYRPEESSSALARFLAELNRLRTAYDVVLRPLGRTQVARMISATLRLDGPLSAGLLDEMVEATDGIPFLVEEVLRTLVEDGGIEPTETGWGRRSGATLQIPRSLRQALDARMDHLPATVVRIAELAAVVGQVVDAGLLQRIGLIDERTLWPILRLLVDAQIIEVRPDGHLAFRHALTRDALLARAPAPERQALHRAVAEMVEVDPSISPATIAEHWERAGEPLRAAPFALRAAERAAAVHAHREAIAHFEQALLGQATPDSSVLTALGDHYAALNECDAAVAHYGQAHEIYTAHDDTIRAANLHRLIGIAYGRNRQRTAATRHLAIAFANLPLAHPERWQAGVELARQLAASGAYESAEMTLADVARASDNGGDIARWRVAYELGGLRSLRGDWSALERAGTAVLQGATGDDDAQLALRHDAHAALGTVGYYRGAFADAVDHFTSCLTIADRRGVATDQATARWNLATNALYHLGRWPEARHELAELQALGVGVLSETAQWFERWLDGRWEEAADAWMRAWSQMEASADLEVLQAHGRRVADLLLLLDRPEQALTFLGGILERVRAVGAVSFEMPLAPREAEALARLGDPRAAAACADGIAMARRLGAVPAEGLLLRARGQVHRAMDRWSEAFADWDAAVDILNALPMPYEAARTQREAALGRLARGRRGDRARAAEYLRSAQRHFADVGAARDEAATTALLTAAGLAERIDRRTGPLTAREWEVAELVGNGCSNRDIAQRLFITEKTAAYHVSAILTKLDFTARSQIAAYVARRHPDGPQDAPI